MPTLVSVSGLNNPLLTQDAEQLAAQLQCDVELVQEGAQVGVIVRWLSLPDGIYNRPQTDLLMQTTGQYPAADMDMFWVDRELLLFDGRVPQGAESLEPHFGRMWRRYSWHRNAPWLPGRDSLISHFEFSVARLQRPE
jgi:hypothetical protein